MRQETAVQSPLQRTAGTGLMESTPPASLNALPQEKKQWGGESLQEPEGSSGIQSICVSCYGQEQHEHLLLQIKSHVWEIVLFGKLTISHWGVVLFVQHYTFYVHQTNSLKFPVRSSISDHNIKASTHTYSHCSGITFLATSTAGTMTGLLTGPIGHKLVFKQIFFSKTYKQSKENWDLGLL